MRVTFVAPPYPAIVQAARVRGLVIIEATISGSALPPCFPPPPDVYMLNFVVEAKAQPSSPADHEKHAVKGVWNVQRHA